MANDSLISRASEFLSHASDSHALQNVGSNERLASTVGGASLLLAGLARGRMTGAMMAIVGGSLLYRGWTGHCSLYQSLGIDTAEHNRATAIPARQGMKVEATVAVNRPPKDVFAFWRDLKNLPRVMRHLERIEVLSDKRSRWFARGPLARVVEWEADIIGEREPEMIAWRSLPGSEVDTAGSVHFKSLGHDQGTTIQVSLKYNPPAGKVGATIASWLGADLEHQLNEDLQHFKSYMETGQWPERSRAALKEERPVS